MTTSFPTVPTEPNPFSAPPAGSAGLPPLPGVPGAVLPDFAGVLAGATPGAGPVPPTGSMPLTPGAGLPAAPVVVPPAGQAPGSRAGAASPVEPSLPAFSAPLRPGAGPAAPATTVPPPAVSGNVFTGAGRAIRNQTASAASTPAAAAPGAGEVSALPAPTRAEQEEAMAMLAALFPFLPPATPATVAATAPAESGASVACPVPPDMPEAPALPGNEPARRFGQAVPPAVAGEWQAMAAVPAPRTNPSDPADRSGFSRQTAVPPGAESPAGPGRLPERLPMAEVMPPVPAPAAAGADAMPAAETGGTARGHAAPQSPDRAAPAPLTDMPTQPGVSFSLRPAGPPFAAVEPTVPTERTELPRLADPARHPGVIEAAVVRADGVCLAARVQETAVARATALPAQGPTVAADASAADAAVAVTPRENSAGRERGAAVSFGGEKNPAGKKLLNTSHERLGQHEPVAGTTTANAGDPMNQTAPFPSEAVTPVFTVAPEAGVSPAGSSSGRESVDVAAARTLATVLEVAEVQEASKLRPVPAVHLRVQVGGETVGITVELRDQGVQAQFSAASPELREALTREWQAVQLETREGAPRLLDPVFPSSAGGSATAHDQGGAASRQQQQAHPGLFPWTQAGAFSARRARPAAATAADTPPALSPDSRLLSAVA